MNIKTVDNINIIADSENNKYASIIQETNANKNITVCYDKNTETLFVEKQDYTVIKDLSESQLKELEHHIISCYDEKNVIYGFVKLDDASELRIFNKNLAT